VLAVEVVDRHELEAVERLPVSRDYEAHPLAADQHDP
jgi:hypothetical protein